MTLGDIYKKLDQVGKISTPKFFIYFGFFPAVVTVLFYILLLPERFQNIGLVGQIFAIPAFMVMYLLLIFFALLCSVGFVSILLRVNTKLRERVSEFIADSIVNNDEASADFAERVATHLNKIQTNEYFRKLEAEEKLDKIQSDLQIVLSKITENDTKIIVLENELKKLKGEKI